MAEYGEWNKKGATLSDVTAKTEYGVDREFIIEGIDSGHLDYRDGAIWGNPYIRILRRQLEAYIAAEIGEDYLIQVKAQKELRNIKKELSEIKKKRAALEDRKAILEKLLGK